MTTRNTGSGHDGHPISNLVVGELQAEVLPVTRTRENRASTPLTCPTGPALLVPRMVCSEPFTVLQRADCPHGSVLRRHTLIGRNSMQQQKLQRYHCTAETTTAADGGRR